MALGATSNDILLAFSRRGLALTLGGLGIGVVLAVIAALWRIEVPAHAEPPKEGLGRSLGTAFRHVAASPTLAALILIAGAGSFLAFPLITYLPVIAGDVLKTGAEGFSLLLSSFGMGAIVGAVATAQRGHVAGRGRTLLLALVVYGVATAAAVSSSRQPLSMACLLVSGFSMVTAFSTVNSLVQENAPAPLKGRVLGIYGFAFRGGMPLGSLVSGYLAAFTSAPTVIAVNGVLLSGVATYFLIRSHGVREA